jgi:hypothetical protein
MRDLTPDEADEVLAAYSPDDRAFALDWADRNRVDPLWRAALDRARAREGGGGQKARDHRRGRRG